MNPVPVASGWNWIGYIPQETLSIADALVGLQISDEDLLKTQREFAQFDSAGGNWVGNLTEMRPGQGFKLFLVDTVQDSFYYPSGNAPEARGAPLAADGLAHSIGAPDWTLDYRAFQHDMTVTARVVLPDGADVTDRHLVAALVDGEIRGVKRAVHVPVLDQYRVFLMIRSNETDGEQVAFQIYDPDREGIFAIEQVLEFTADAVIGEVSEPMMLSASGEPIPFADLPLRFVLEQNFPNPFSPKTTIRYALPAASRVSLRIFDVSGRLVRQLVHEHEQRPGRYDVVWEGTDLAGRRVVPGLYFYRLQAGAFRETRKMVILK